MSKTFPMRSWNSTDGFYSVSGSNITMSISVTSSNTTATTATITATVTAYWTKDGYSANQYWVYSPGCKATVTINGSNLGGKVVFGNGKSGGSSSDKYWNGNNFTETWTTTVNRTSSAQNISYSVDYQATVDGNGNGSTYSESGTVSVSALPSYTVIATKGTGISSVSGTGSKTHGSSVTLTATASTGYTFSSWTYGSSTDTSNPWTVTTSITGNISVTANATANKYTVTYNANGGTCSTTSKDVTYNSTYGTLATPTKTGYTFSGWYTAASGGNQVTSSTKVTITSNQTLYAHWTADTYILTFNANGGTNTSGGNFALTTPATGYGETESWVTVTYDSSNFSAMSGNNPTRTGYKFLGWYTSTSGGTQIYDANGGSTDNGTYWSTSGTWNATSDKTVYAQWEALATMFVKVDGSYKAGIPYVKVNGDWKRATAVYVKVNGNWKLSTR